eukprot:352865-Chlamydomonas_euryale.AAC.12
MTGRCGACRQAASVLASGRPAAGGTAIQSFVLVLDGWRRDAGSLLASVVDAVCRHYGPAVVDGDSPVTRARRRRRRVPVDTGRSAFRRTAAFGQEPEAGESRGRVALVARMPHAAGA